MQRKNTQVYIIHLWKETKNGEAWRGKIQNVRTGQSISASRLNELEEFIRRCFNEEQTHQQKQAGGLK